MTSIIGRCIAISKYAKWKSAEQQVVKAFKEAGWLDARRNWDEQFAQKSGKDLVNTEPYCVQIKCGAKHSVVKAYDEAKSAAKKGEIPVAVIRYTDRKKMPKTFTVISFKDFMWLIGGERK